MLGILILESCLFLLLGIICLNKIYKSFYLLFNFFWLSISILSYIMPTGNRIINSETYILIFLFLLFINTGYIFSNLFFHKNKAKVLNEKLSIDSLIKTKWIKLYLIICFIILIYYGLKYTSLLSIYKGVDARNMRFFVGSLFNSTLELLFYNYIVTPSKYLSCFLISFYIYTGSIKLNKIIPLILIVFLSSYIGGGRFIIVYLMFSIITVLILNKKTININNSILIMNRKNIKIYIVVMFFILLSLGTMIYMTSFRNNVYTLSSNEISKFGEVLYKQVIDYNVGPIGALDYALDIGMLTNNNYFGRAVLFPFIEDFFQFSLGYLGISFTSVHMAIAEVLNQEILIGTTTFNALFSALYWFYCDLGMIGIVIYSFSFGIIVEYVIYLFLKYRSIFALGILIHVIYQFFTMNMNWTITSIDSILYLFVLIILFRKERKIIRNNDGI